MSLCDLTMPYVRSIAGDGIPEWMRVTIGAKIENAAFTKRWNGLCDGRR